MTGTRFEALTPEEIDEQRRYRVLRIEVLVVLGLTLGQSAWYSILSIVERLTRGPSLSDQRTVINTAVVPDRPWLEILIKLSDFIFLDIVPLILLAYLVTQIYKPAATWFESLGFGPYSWNWLAKDFSRGVVLAALIGIPGFGFYLLTKAIGINTQVVAAGDTRWWGYGLLILAAIGTAFYEEVIIVGYLFARAKQLYLGPVVTITISALLRGAFHLYQGFGGFIGNVIMGAVFGYYFYRVKRVGPLVMAHALIDIVAFVGYALLANHVSWL